MQEETVVLAATIDNDGSVPGGQVIAPTTPVPVSLLDSALTADISAISRIDAVASVLEVICRTTGMGFAAVARVTQDRWVACAVRDEIAFGLLPGESLASKPRSATKFVTAVGP